MTWVIKTASRCYKSWFVNEFDERKIDKSILFCCFVGVMNWIFIGHCGERLLLCCKIALSFWWAIIDVCLRFVLTKPKKSLVNVYCIDHILCHYECIVVGVEVCKTFVISKTCKLNTYGLEAFNSKYTSYYILVSVVCDLLSISVFCWTVYRWHGEASEGYHCDHLVSWRCTHSSAVCTCHTFCLIFNVEFDQKRGG